jgi:hypothetical protein
MFDWVPEMHIHQVHQLNHRVEAHVDQLTAIIAARENAWHREARDRRREAHRQRVAARNRGQQIEGPHPMGLIDGPRAPGTVGAALPQQSAFPAGNGTGAPPQAAPAGRAPRTRLGRAPEAVAARAAMNEDFGGGPDDNADTNFGLDDGPLAQSGPNGSATGAAGVVGPAGVVGVGEPAGAAGTAGDWYVPGGTGGGAGPAGVFRW